MTELSPSTFSGSLKQGTEPIRDDLLAVTPFGISGSRRVHGEEFPLGLKLEATKDGTSIEAAVRKVEELALKGSFDDLLYEAYVNYQNDDLRDD